MSDNCGRFPLIISVPLSAAANALRGPRSEANRQKAFFGKEK